MREYQVTINGISTTLQLSDEDAQRAGVGDQPADKSGRADNKARTTKPGTSSTGTSHRGGGKRSRAKTTEPQPDEADEGGGDDASAD